MSVRIRRAAFPEPIKSVLKVIKQACEDLDLTDVWRTLSPIVHRYKWRRKKPELHCRLNFFLINSHLICDTNRADIVPGYKTDHSMTLLTWCEMTLKQQQPFSPYAFYVRIAMIVTYATPLSGAPLITRRPLMRTEVRLPVAGLDATPAHIPTHRPLLPLPKDTLRSSLSIPVSAKTWCMRLNAVPATKCTSERMGDA